MWHGFWFLYCYLYHPVADYLVLLSTLNLWILTKKEKGRDEFGLLVELPSHDNDEDDA